MQVLNLILLLLFTIANTNGYLTYGQDCDPDLQTVPETQCDPDKLFQCILRRCSCPSPLNHKPEFDVNNTAGICVILAGAPCSPETNVGEVSCISSSTCLADSNSPTGFRCKCDEGYVAKLDRICEKSYMQSCGDTLGQCSSDAGLRCVDNLCQCNYHPDQIWDTVKNTCASPLNGYCRDDDDGAGIFCFTDDEAMQVNCIVSDSNPYSGTCMYQ